MRTKEKARCANPPRRRKPKNKLCAKKPIESKANPANLAPYCYLLSQGATAQRERVDYLRPVLTTTPTCLLHGSKANSTDLATRAIAGVAVDGGGAAAVEATCCSCLFLLAHASYCRMGSSCKSH